MSHPTSHRNEREIGAIAAPGIDDGAVIAALVGRAHGKLIHVQLAEHDGAIGPEIGGDGGFVARLEPIQNMGTGLRVHALGGEQILHAERDTFEGSRLALGQPLVGSRSHRARLIGRCRDIGIQRRVRGVDGRKISIRQLDGGELLGLQRVSGFGDRKGGEIGHELLFGRFCDSGCGRARGERLLIKNGISAFRVIGESTATLETRALVNSPSGGVLVAGFEFQNSDSLLGRTRDDLIQKSAANAMSLFGRAHIHPLHFGQMGIVALQRSAADGLAVATCDPNGGGPLGHFVGRHVKAEFRRGQRQQHLVEFRDQRAHIILKRRLFADFNERHGYSTTLGTRK